MDCLAMVFVDEFSISFQHFLSFCQCLAALNVCHLQLTLDWPSNVNAIQKLLSGLKNVLQKPHEVHFKGFGSGFTEHHSKLDADTLLHLVIHCGGRGVVKTMCVHSTVSRGRLMQQPCRSVTLASPFIFFHRGSYNNNSPGTFQ
jgi:hypothetical protein